MSMTLSKKVSDVVAPGSAGATTDAAEHDPISIRALIFVRDRGIFVLFALLVLAFAVWANPFFASWDNATLIANAAALTAIYGAGVAVGIICGALDLSIPGTAALAACVCGKMLVGPQPVWLSLLVALVIGAVVG